MFVVPFHAIQSICKRFKQSCSYGEGNPPQWCAFFPMVHFGQTCSFRTFCSLWVKVVHGTEPARVAPSFEASREMTGARRRRLRHRAGDVCAAAHAATRLDGCEVPVRTIVREALLTSAPALPAQRPCREWSFRAPQVLLRFWERRRRLHIPSLPASPKVPQNLPGTAGFKHARGVGYSSIFEIAVVCKWETFALALAAVCPKSQQG